MILQRVRNTCPQITMSIIVPRGSLATGSRFASRRTSICTVLSAAEERIEDFTYAELVAAIEKLRTTNRQLRLENAVFEHFVARFDPVFIEGLDQAVAAAAQAAAAQHRALAVAAAAQPTPTLANLAARRGTDESLGSPRHSVRSPSVMRYGSLVGAKQAKMGVRHKLDLASRQTEELEKTVARSQASMQKARREHAARMAQLQATCEQVQLAAVECAQLKAKGRRLTANDFIDWLSTWLANSAACAERLRQRADTLSATYRRLCRSFEAAARADAVRGVDVERLHIDLNDTKRRLREANDELRTLNEATGHQWQISARHVSATESANPKIAAARAQCDRIDNRISRTKERARQVSIEVDALRTQLGVLRQLRENYKCPDVGDYLRLKAEVASLRKEIKTVRRRIAIENAGHPRAQGNKTSGSKDLE